MEDRDSFRAQQQEIDDRVKSGHDWQGETIYQDEEIYVYETGDKSFVILPDDLFEFMKSLPKEELIESLEMLNERQLAQCLGVEKTYASKGK